MDARAQTYFDRLRRDHFPPERNFLQAHVTLFHALPQQQRAAIGSHLQDITALESPMKACADKLQSLGGGVAFRVDCPRLESLRASLSERWLPDLTAQDRCPRRLHITVQNKVPASTAKALLEALSRDFEPHPLLFQALDLWQYLNGPWRLLATFPFSSDQLTTRPIS
jgi:hypothetical protein